VGNKTIVKMRGRPKADNPLIFKSLGLTAAQWEWLGLWFPGGNPTEQIRELFERSVKFWPSGPGKFR
jgi:hypothetical protein